MNDWAVQQVMEIAAKLRQALEQTEVLGQKLVATGASVEPYVDVVATMPVNPRPTDPPAWWQRTPEQITGITIHHTMSHDPVATARYCTDVKGRPSIQYHFWIEADGRALLCAPLVWGMWHDHCGHCNKNISLGLAGHLHQKRPPEAQLEGAARLIRWLMVQFAIPLAEVQGHNERYRGTICPGWGVIGWRDDLMGRL